MQSTITNTNLRLPDPLKVHGGDVADNWKRFREQWTNYEVASDLSTASEEYARRARRPVVNRRRWRPRRTYTAAVLVVVEAAAAAPGRSRRRQPSAPSWWSQRDPSSTRRAASIRAATVDASTTPAIMPVLPTDRGAPSASSRTISLPSAERLRHQPYSHVNSRPSKSYPRMSTC